MAPMRSGCGHDFYDSEVACRSRLPAPAYRRCSSDDNAGRVRDLSVETEAGETSRRLCGFEAWFRNSTVYIENMQMSLHSLRGLRLRVHCC